MSARVKRQSWWGVLAVPLCCGVALAQPSDDGQGGAGSQKLSAAELAKLSAELLEHGKVESALVTLEEAADHGVRHPDLAFNRGVAYLRRAETANARAADLGQAAAGFAEALAARPDDAEAARGLEEAQLAVARRESRGATKEQGAQVQSPLGLMERAILSLAPWGLFAVACAASCAACVALILRRAQAETTRLVGNVTLGVSVLILLPALALGWGREQLFGEARMAVVVATEAPLLDEAGRSIVGAQPLRESAVVYVGPQERGLVPLIGLGQSTWLRVGQLRLVSHRPL